MSYKYNCSRVYILEPCAASLVIVITMTHNRKECLIRKMQQNICYAFPVPAGCIPITYQREIFTNIYLTLSSASSLAKLVNGLDPLRLNTGVDVAYTSKQTSAELMATPRWDISPRRKPVTTVPRDQNLDQATEITMRIKAEKEYSNCTNAGQVNNRFINRVDSYGK